VCTAHQISNEAKRKARNCGKVQRKGRALTPEKVDYLIHQFNTEASL
jgi:hypothetical protein